LGRFIRIQRINKKISKIIVRNGINLKKAQRRIEKTWINKRFSFKRNKTLQRNGSRWSRKESFIEGKWRINIKKSYWKSSLTRIKKWNHQIIRIITNSETIRNWAFISRPSSDERLQTRLRSKFGLNKIKRKQI